MPTTDSHLKIKKAGSNASEVTLKGDPKSPESSTFLVKFPGGCVEISRTTQGDYWVHVRPYQPDDSVVIEKIREAGEVVDYRLNLHPNSPDWNRAIDDSEFHGPPSDDVQHMAVLISRLAR
jgi:hypothetical protein